MYRSLTEMEQQLLHEVTESSLMAYTQEISQEVRLSGSPEELRAFQYAQNQLESFGVSTELFMRDAYISLPVSASVVLGDQAYQAITHSMSIPVQSLSASVVDVKNGSPEDYAAVDVSGKVVFVTGLANPPAVIAAAQAGAVGAIFTHGRYTHEMIVTPVWGMPTPESEHNRPTIPVVSVNLDDGLRIREQLDDNEERRCTITTEVDTDIRPIPTLIADIKGDNSSDEFILFSGHIDSWHYGVMDNGTANAVMLEVARILSQYQGQLRRSVRFAFWSGHSHGRYAGSTWYCDEHWEELREHCCLHVNIDSVGAKNASVLTKSSCMAETKSLAADAIGVLANQVFEGRRMSRMGDQSFFGTGTPSLFVGLSEQPEGGLGWWWHTTEDTLDKIDPTNLVRDCKIYLLILYRTLTDAIVPLDLLSSVQEVYDTLEDLQNRSQNHVDLTECVRRADELRDCTKRLYDCIATIDLEDTTKVALVNRTLVELSGQLVPLGYVRNSVFDHDAALDQSAIPKLDGIHTLQCMNPENETYHFLKARIIRRINEVQWMLRCAQKTVTGMIQFLETANDKDSVTRV